GAAGRRPGRARPAQDLAAERIVAARLARAGGVVARRAPALPGQGGRGPVPDGALDRVPPGPGRGDRGVRPERAEPREDGHGPAGAAALAKPRALSVRRVARAGVERGAGRERARPADRQRESVEEDRLAGRPGDVRDGGG